MEVYASVTDERGAPVTGLTRDDFTVREDDEVQAIAAFAEGEFPLSVALAIDRSWSMAGEPLARARQAARTLIGALRPVDQSMLVAVSGRIETVAPLSTDRTPALGALAALDPWSTTALNDAVIQTVDLVQAGTGRRALVILSDGADRYSAAGAAEVVAHVRGRDVMVYPVALGRQAPPLFAELAALTGGRSFHAPTLAPLEAAMREIAADLHHQYLLGYAPAHPSSAGTWRSISVTVNVPRARVRARRGYVAG